MKIGWLKARDLPELQAYVEDHWEAGHVLARDADLVRWQYRHPDGEDLLSVLGAHVGGRLVGFLGLIQTPFAWLGGTLAGAWLATWSVAPELRGRGTGPALLLDALQRFEVVAVLGFNKTAERIFDGAGFHVRRALPRWVRAVDAAAAARLGVDIPPAGAPGKPIEPVEWSDAAAEAWERRWRERLLPRVVGAARDAAFLRWRYVEHPSFHYVVRFARDTEALCVHRLEQVRDRDETVIRFVELLGEPDAVAGLAAGALAEAPTAALADFFCSAHELAAPLEQLGFVREDALAEAPPDRFQPLARSRGLGGAFWRRDGGGAAFTGVPLYVTRADGDQDRPR